ncbi:MAG: alpha/beta hydrolase [Frankiales bacterium]|nr:alpha/beta hydrolase [Frankiales bacterium]
MVTALQLPQTFVTIGTEKIHLIDVGAGPSIVLETGAGGAAAAWLPVMAVLRNEARTVAVDRPGAGWSSPGDAVLPDHVARRLHAALLAADIPPPYLLVGHSLGALYVRAFAAAFPRDTCGLVLIDPTHEQMHTVLASAGRVARFAEKMLVGLLGLVAVLPIPGASRIAAPLVAPSRVMDLLTDVPALRRLLTRRATRRPALRASLRERRSVAEACAAVPPPDAQAELPVLVVSASDFDSGGRQAVMREGINGLHADLATRWRNGQHFVATGTTHMLPIEAPAVAADAIRSVLAQSHTHDVSR